MQKFALATMAFYTMALPLFWIGKEILEIVVEDPAG